MAKVMEFAYTVVSIGWPIGYQHCYTVSQTGGTLITTWCYTFATIPVASIPNIYRLEPRWRTWGIWNARVDGTVWKSHDFKIWEPWSLKDLFPLWNIEDLYWARTPRLCTNPAFPPCCNLATPEAITSSQLLGSGDQIWYPTVVYLGKLFWSIWLTKRSFCATLCTVGHGDQPQVLLRAWTHHSLSGKHQVDLWGSISSNQFDTEP